MDNPCAVVARALRTAVPLTANQVARHRLMVDAKGSLPIRYAEAPTFQRGNPCHAITVRPMHLLAARACVIPALVRSATFLASTFARRDIMHRSIQLLSVAPSPKGICRAAKGQTLRLRSFAMATNVRCGSFASRFLATPSRCCLPCFKRSRKSGPNVWKPQLGVARGLMQFPTRRPSKIFLELPSIGSYLRGATASLNSSWISSRAADTQKASCSNYPAFRMCFSS
jgi:hypothetical protein